MAYPRSYLNLTPLPDGTVLATGGGTTTDGGNLNDGVLPAEDWNPATGQWTTWASMAVPRLYHSIAMLLPDGRVLVAGTGDLPGVPNEMNAQIFSPPYLFNGPRPTITSSPSVVQYGSNFQVSTPDAASITSVSLIRTAAVTHSFDESTRRVSLPFTVSNGALNVQAPANGADAPPGNYMLFIVNSNGVPSVASWVHLPAPYTEDTTPPSAPSGLTATATSSSSVSLSWTASTDNVGVTGYNIFRNGVQIGTSTTTSYTDNSVASNTAVHLYRHRLRRGRQRQHTVQLRHRDNAPGAVPVQHLAGRHADRARPSRTIRTRRRWACSSRRPAAGTSPGCGSTRRPTIPARISAACGLRPGRCWRPGRSAVRPRRGWQELDFSSPVAVTAGTTYVASYFTSTGYPA